MIARFRSLAFATALLAGSTAAHASLFLDYSDGMIILSGTVGDADKDDGIATGSRPLTGSYFGQTFTDYTPTISINGHVNFVGDGDYFNYPLGSSFINRIAPMWQDYRIGDNGRIIEHLGLGEGYYAITWLNVENVNAPDHVASFQAIFVETAITLNGVDFLAGDIVFSYGEFTNGFIGDEPTIGLENEAGEFGGIAPLPGTEDTNGVFYSIHGDVLPNGEGQYVLFRPDGAGNYTVTIENSLIPEPSAYAAIAGGFALACVAFRRRR